MNICYVVPALVNKAPVMVALALAKHMALMGHQVSVWYFDEIVHVDVPRNIHIRRVEMKLLPRNEEYNFDVVHSHMLRPDIFLFINRARFTNAICISTLHNYFFDDLRNKYKSYLALAIAMVWNFSWLRHDKLVALTKDGVKYYLDRSFNKKITYCYNGVDLIRQEGMDASYLPLIKDLRSSFTVVGTYCNLGRSKGLDQVLLALKLNPTLAFVIIGDGPEKEFLLQEAERLYVKERCLFLPAVSSPYIYNDFFDVFVMPSRCEGFGLALVEAALSKAKIVCSNIPVFKELFDDTEVTYFELENPKSLVKAFQVACSNGDKPFRAYARALGNYTASAMAVSYLKVYEKCLVERVDN